MGVCGIYKITSKTTGLSYIGKSEDVHRRFKLHLMSKQAGKLSRAIQEYGKDDFYLEVLEECSIDELDTKENEHILKERTFGYDGYNTHYSLDDFEESKGKKRPRTFTLNEKIIDALKDHSDETGIPQAKIVSKALIEYLIK